MTGRLGRAPLDALLRTLLADHGFRDVDVSGVDALVGGYLVGGPGSARVELEELMRLCGIVAHSDGGRLIFRSTASLSSRCRLTKFADEDPSGPLIERRRAEDSELAEEVVVEFSDPARAYQAGAASAVLADRTFPRQETIELPVVVEEWEARRYATAALGMIVGGRESVRFALPPTDVETVPGDVVEIDGIGGRWLVTRIESDATQRVEARRLSAVTGVGRNDAATMPAPAPNRPPEVSEPVVVFLDLPQGSAASPESAARVASFAEPFLSLAIDASQAQAAFETRLIDADPATIGELATAFNAGPEGLIDRANAIEVQLYRGALFSITHEQLLAGGNLCAVMSRNGEWEVLQFERADEIAPLRFRLSSLVRAQGGTEDAMAAGATAGAIFVLLDASVEPVNLRSAEIGVPMSWRAAAIGRPLDEATTVTQAVTLGNRAVRPLSPVHLRAAFAPDGVLRLRWTRRTRIGGDAWEGLDVPLGEDIERYQIIVSDADGREIGLESDTGHIELPASEQMRVFGGLPPRLIASVAQFSLRYGVGTKRRAVFDRPPTAA